MRRLLLATTLILTATAAQANLIGTQVTLVYNFDYPGYVGPTSTTDVFTAGAGIEAQCTGGGSGNANVCFMLSAPNQSVDFGASTITYTFTSTGLPGGFNPQPVNGFSFQTLDGDGPIGGYTLSTNIAGLDGSRISFTSSSIDLYMGGLALGFAGTFELTLQIPEPTTLGLLTVGMLGLRATRRRGAGVTGRSAAPG